MRKQTPILIVHALGIGLWIPCASGCGPAGGSAPAATSGTNGSGTGSGAGAGTASGGTPGSGSSAAGATTCPSASCDLIDDMEAAGAGMMNDGILMNEGRTGYWYVYNDATAGGTQVPNPTAHTFIPDKIMPPRGTSLYAAHTTGMGFTTWGAGFGFDINNPGGADGGGNGTPMPYDTTKFQYKGIYFFAKVGTNSTGTVRVNLSDKQSNPAGGVCNPASTAPHGMQCSDDAGYTVTGLTSAWQGIEVDFSMLSRQGFGPAGAFDPTTLYYIHWQVTQNNQFDIWIDDIYFLK